MAGNAENQYAPGSNESNPGGAWGAAPPIMHSWCLQSDEPASGSAQADSKARLASDADDDCGFDLNLGLSLGGGKSTKPKGRDKEKEVLLDRDTFRDKDERRDGVVAKDGVLFKPFKTEHDEANPSRVQHSFWQDLDRPGGGEAQEKAALPPRQVEPGRRAGENSVAEDSKMFAQHMWQALQGKAAQPEHQRVPLSAQDEASLIKELQGLPPQAVATAAAWARVVAQGGFPMQILEAIKDGVDPGMSRGMALQRSVSLSKSHSSGPHSEVNHAASPPNANLERSDSDVSKNMQIAEEQHRQVAIIQQQEIAEQQRKRELQTQKRQEARRKRKALLEGQKSKKSTKKEDERPGSVGPGGSQGSRSGLDTPPSSLRRTSSLQPMSKENSVSMGSSPPDSQDAGGASSISAFRRLGSTSWLHNWDGSNPAKPKSEKDARVESGEQTVEIRRSLERAKNRGAKDRDEDSAGHAESNSETVRKVSSPDVVQMQRMDLDSNAGGARQVMNRQEGSNLGPPAGMMNGSIDPAWIHKIMEMQMMPNLPQMQRRGEGGAERAAPMAEPEKAAKKGRASSQTSSGGTESSGGQDEKSGNGVRVRVVHGDADALSSPAATSAAAEPRSNPPTATMPSVSNAMAMANMAFPQGGGFPMMPGAFPFPLPVPPGGGPGGVPFSVPFPFPYLMQFAPNPAAAGDANNPEQRAHPNMPSPFQIALPAGFNPPFQIQAPEGAPAAWPSAVVRPLATPLSLRLGEPPLRSRANPQSHAMTTSTTLGVGSPLTLLFRRNNQHFHCVILTCDRTLPGAKGKEHARSRNTSPARDSPAKSLVKASSMSSGAFNRLRTTGAPPSPLAPQFGLSRSKSDAVALRREGSVGSAFASPAEQQPPPPPSSSPPESGPIAPQPELPAAQSTSAPEEVARRPQPTGVWCQGSLPSFEGIAGQDASSLRPGVAPGVHFGGTGTPPDLPWVTCNGTVSGVLYRVEKGQVRIVCACHGWHMTPAEFVQHAGCGEIPNPEKAIVVGPFTVMSQQPASAQA